MDQHPVQGRVAILLGMLQAQGTGISSGFLDVSLVRALPFSLLHDFRCLYLKMSQTSAIQLETRRKRIRANASDSGMFDINLGVFKDVAYTRPYGDQSFPIGVMVNERVYLQLSVDSKDPRLAVIAQRCHATPDPNPNSTLQYDLIQNG